ncbi:HAD family hydrolase [Methylocystis sp. S23]|jgi:putative hydrolase of the HAD superfamily
MISAVLFDLDETLLDRTGSLVAFLADQYHRFGDRLGSASFEAWRDEFLALDARGHVHKSLVYPTILATFSGDPAIAELMLVDYQENCCRYAMAFRGMTETLATLRARGLAIGVVTNGESAFQSRHIEALRLRERVDAILISESEGLRKPDRRLFMRAAKRLDVQPAHCLFVGDNPTVDILGAHAAGMATAWFRSGMAWPADLEAPPGAVIDALPEVLDLIWRKA